VPKNEKQKEVSCGFTSKVRTFEEMEKKKGRSKKEVEGNRRKNDAGAGREKVLPPPGRCLENTERDKNQVAKDLRNC